MNSKAGLLLIPLFLLPLAAWADDSLELTVQHEEDDDAWRASYRAEVPIEGLVFERPAQHFRSTHWRVSTPGYSFRLLADREVLVLDEGAPSSRELSVEFGVYADYMPGEYSFFMSFSDSSAALYTGHVYAATFDPDETTLDPNALTYCRSMTLIPREGEHLVVDGSVRAGPSSWTDSSGKGTYAYFGTIRTVKSTTITAILDPGLPKWLAQSTSRLIPRLFDFYAEQLGVALDFVPVLLMTYDAADIPNRDYLGGTLPGQVQLGVTGRTWSEQDSDSKNRIFHFIAHESAHFWNAEMFAYENPDASWMHEGSADALADRAMRAFGMISQDELEARYQSALSECGKGLDGFALDESNQHAAYRNNYTCGLVLATWTERALQEVHPNQTLFDFWKALLAKAASNGNRYSEATYRETLLSMGVDHRAADRILAMTHTPPAKSPLPDLMSQTTH
jgi:hypothetical protein